MMACGQRVNRCLTAALALSLLGLPAAAAGADRTLEASAETSAGKRAILSRHERHDVNCKPLEPPKLTLTVPAKAGSVCKTLARWSGQIPTQTYPPRRKQCAGKPVRGYEVWFTPAAGFAGTASFEYRVDSDKLLDVGSARVRVKASVDVKKSAARGGNQRRQKPGPMPDCSALRS